ncbi:hypothetical protein O6H91_Y466100 [Diphasiastrum complanatum]|nr:hypothetical protein O6H91_Y466100 [Diphasiastrum complanatum]
MWKVGVSMALLVSVTAVSLGVSIGRLISLPSGQEGINILCNNTLQGPYLLSDDRGYICTTTVLDTVTGCCPEDAQQFSCRGCNLSSSCCDSYEYCVACCLDPKKTTTERALRSKVSKQATAKTYSSVFEYCSGRCRHNSASVVHENAYASEEHHCFFLKPNPTEQVKKFQEDDVMDISLIIGRQGQSCDSACQGRGQLCKLSKLTILNKCSISTWAAKVPVRQAWVQISQHRWSAWHQDTCTLEHAYSVLRVTYFLAMVHILTLGAYAHVHKLCTNASCNVMNVEIITRELCHSPASWSMLT